MSVCYRKVGNRYYSPSEYKKFKARNSTTVRHARYKKCPRCCRSRCAGERICEDCGYPYWQDE